MQKHQEKGNKNHLKIRHVLSVDEFLTLSGPAFSVVRQARGGGGGSEAQMPKIEVNINQLK